MSSTFTLAVLLGTCLFISSIPDAASYTKYGRTCQDIGCRRDEVCVMAEDPCSIYQRDNCGRYPTCAKAQSGGANCASTVCGENEYCKTENGMPMCVKKSTAIVPPTRTSGRLPVRPPPTPPPRSSSHGFGGRYSGSSGSRNSIGAGSIFNRLFGDDRNYGTTTLRPRIQPGAGGYYNTRTNVDANGNRVWTFSG